MPRKLRVQYEGAMYHVMSTGDRWVAVGEEGRPVPQVQRRLDQVADASFTSQSELNLPVGPVRVAKLQLLVLN